MQADSGDDAMSANPTRSGHIPKVKAKVAGAIKELFNKKTQKPAQKRSSSLHPVKNP